MRRFFKSIALAALFCPVFFMLSSCHRAAPFYIGADMSHIPMTEAHGMVYHNQAGEVEDPLQIMADNGFNIIRLRTFVNPAAEGGYSKDGFCDLDHTIRLAKRIKEAGMEFAIDFHYSDYWADPDKQYKPSDWKDADGNPLTGTALEDKLYEYTKNSLQAMKDAGVAPVIIQIGNEINHGMVWPEGFINDNATEEDWAALMGLYKAGQRAAREVLPKSKLQVHLALGGENTLCRQFLDKMLKYGAQFDIIGLSYYERWHETYDDMKGNIYDLTERYGTPVCICEYGAAKENIKIINDIVRSVPNSLGIGTMAWEPGQVLFTPEGMAQPTGMPSPGPHRRRFDPNVKADDAIFGIYREIRGQYADSRTQPVVEPPFKRDFNIALPIKTADYTTQKALAGQKKEGAEYIRLNILTGVDTDQYIAQAKEIKAAGLKLLLAIHYSDTPAGLTSQSVPSSWRETGSGLEGKAYSYSQELVNAFIAEGCRPDMVQIGNKINNGILWPQGRIDGSYQSCGVLLRCASAGVRTADPTIIIALGIAPLPAESETKALIDRFKSRDIKFDTWIRER